MEARFAGRKAVCPTLEPLERVRVVVDGVRGPLTATVTDAAGRRMFRTEVRPRGGRAEFAFVARGALGEGRVSLRDGSRRALLRYRLEASTALSCDDAALSELVPRVRAFLANDVTTYYIDGHVVHGYRSPDTTPIWLRDHTHQLKAARYFDPDVRSALEYFLRTQREDGSLWDFVVLEGATQSEGGEPRKPTHARCEVEADVEYLAVECAYLAWQATGDDEWLASVMPALERAVSYTMTDEWRWSREYGLVKRPFTVDTWDYEYGNCPWQRERAHMCIMHGDQSGLYRALLQLSAMSEALGRPGKARSYAREAQALRERANKVCWNGRFYTHQVHIDPVEVKGVDESEQLSLSNPYDCNRGLPTHEMAVSIIREYKRRREAYGASRFAEWFSIDPPFPTDSFETHEGAWTKYAGHYTNGGILPLVGGELARAALEHGEEAYGVDILRRYAGMVKRTGETYLWYHWDGTPGRSSPGSLATDGWGSAAMLDALLCGLAGVVDESTLYRRVRVAPRWAAAGIRRARVVVRYAASAGYLAYTYEHDPRRRELRIHMSGSGERAAVWVLLPECGQAGVTVNGRPANARLAFVEQSRYAGFDAPVNAEIRVRYR